MVKEKYELSTISENITKFIVITHKKCKDVLKCNNEYVRQDKH